MSDADDGHDVEVRDKRTVTEAFTGLKHRTAGELGLCDGAPADDAMHWTPIDPETRVGTD